MADTPIDDRALDSMSVAPGGEGRNERQDAGQDAGIAKRLKDDPEDSDARLDAGLDESMDASDPPSSTQPVHRHGEPAPSSGFDAAEEAERQQDA